MRWNRRASRKNKPRIGNKPGTILKRDISIRTFGRSKWNNSRSTRIVFIVAAAQLWHCLWCSMYLFLVRMPSQANVMEFFHQRAFSLTRWAKIPFIPLIRSYPVVVTAERYDFQRYCTGEGRNFISSKRERKKRISHSRRNWSNRIAAGALSMYPEYSRESTIDGEKKARQRGSPFFADITSMPS